MLHHLQAAGINDFHNVETIAEEVLSTSPTYEKLGISTYPTISLINHSCNPTASALMSDKGIMIIYAMQSLCAGSQLSIKYHSYFYEQSTEERQKCLKLLATREMKLANAIFSIANPPQSLREGGLIFICGSIDGVLSVAGRRHNANDINATVIAVQPTKIVYRGR
ncbi:unnamed protein product [Rodentolepis nana]|uniref:SET domain-containing protein n=1 Tax=Rodentolepis nana TaxID=102285 RepID=A0A0R3TCN8_RODNA|nr:unnamed protein product [Rodentolepis nana]